jgi:hypothetical protein
MAISSSWLYHHHGYIIIMATSSSWLYHHHGYIIIMAISSSWLYHHHGYNMLDWHFLFMFAHTFAKPMEIKTEIEELLI